LTENENDLIELLNILLRVVEANKGVPSGEDDRILDAEGLAIKFYGHVLSSFYLWRGVNIFDLEIPIENYPDPSSLDVLVRAAFETYLVFYWVFIDSEYEDEKDFRFYSWEVAALYARQNFRATTQENIKKLQDEKIYINKIKSRIKDNSIFKKYSEKQQKSYYKKLEKGIWRLKGWAEIAGAARFSELNSKIIYSFLSEHAHSGNISVTQVRQSKDIKIRRELMNASIGHLLICVSKMIKSYCEDFHKSREFYTNNYPEPNVVSLWVSVGEED
jgi:hypothetical protein